MAHLPKDACTFTKKTLRVLLVVQLEKKPGEPGLFRGVSGCALLRSLGEGARRAARESIGQFDHLNISLSAAGHVRPCADGSARATRRPARRRRRGPCRARCANASFSRPIASSVLPSRKFRPPRLFVSWPTWTWSESSSYAVARPLGVVAREHPVALAVGDERGLEVRGADRAGVVRVLGELERALDVLARGLVVALAAPAARAPREDVRAELVGRQARALGERERLVAAGRARSGRC